jgi:hypothetical protein
MKTSLLTLLTFVALGFSMSVSAKSEDAPVDQTENIQARIAESDFVVDICVYEMEWIPATKEDWKAKWVQRAVVTGVHKGVIPIGTKLEFYYSIEEPPKLFKTRFRTVVEGELYTFFFSRDEGTLKDGKYTLDAPGNFRFGRDESDFAAAFKKELKSNPELKPKSEQAAPSNGGKHPK